VLLKSAISQVSTPPTASQSTIKTSGSTSIEERSQVPGLAGSILLTASGLPGSDEIVMPMLSMTKKTAFSIPNGERTSGKQNSERESVSDYNLL
jgi:hypothetical protein